MKLKKDRINVWDFVMGAGKTQNIIGIINKNPDVKILFVTPILDEVTRIVESCSGLTEPTEALGEGTKARHFYKLIEEGKSIATTHKLFMALAREDASLFSEYTLILDEVFDAVEHIKMTYKDVHYITHNEELVKIHSNNTVEWLDEDYKGVFDDLMKKIRTRNVILFEGTSFVWTFPPEIFNSFNEVMVLTYNFEGSILYPYFQYNDITFDIISESKAVFKTDILVKIRRLLDIYDVSKYNRVGKPTKPKENPLSVNWYKGAAGYKFDKLNSNTRSFFRSHCNLTSSEFAAFTCPMDYYDTKNKTKKIAPKGYATEFIVVNQKATNEYRHKTALAYLVNRFLDPVIGRYFAQKGIKINQDAWSLNELIQWLWRGCIRDDKEMKVYIPSSRMRSLLDNWLNPR